MDRLLGAGGGGGGALGGPLRRFVASLPPVTRIWLGATLVVTAAANLGFVEWDDLDLARWDDATGRGRSGRVEAWRLITCFLCVGKFGLNAVIGLHLMTQISARYETMGPICTRRIHIDPPRPAEGRAGERPYVQRERNNSPYHPRGETSDYVFTLLFGMSGILLSNFALLPKLPASITHRQHHRFFYRHLTFFVVYIWSKQHSHHRVNLFGVNLAAMHLPFAYLAIGYALNNGEVIPLDILHGMFVGHVYFYLACIVPPVLGRGRALLSTPRALVDLCDWLEGRGPAGIDGRGNEDPMLVDVDGVIGG